MSDPQNISEAPEIDSALISVTNALEQIIETVPDDMIALEMLAYLSEIRGDLDKMQESLLKLAKAIVCEGDAELAEYIHGRMIEVGLCEDMGEDVCRLVEQLAVKKISGGDDSFSNLIVNDSSQAFKVMDELSFAWRLFEAGELNSSEYADVAHDLSEMAADGHLSTISVLHCLEARAFAGMERVMAFIAQDTKVPIITLSLFDIQDTTIRLLPLDFMIKRGVIVFDLIGDDALVAVMNPVDRALRKQVEMQVKKKCHYYISLPAEFDAVIQKISTN